MCCPQCSGTNCYFTIYHTQAYKYSDAQELLQRIQCRDSGIEVPPQTQLRLADPLLPAISAGSADCSTGCRTKQGKPKQANVRCISHMCSDCCAAATQRAFDQNVERDACKTHRQGVVLARPPPVAPVQLAPAIAPLPVQPVAAVLRVIPGSSSSGSHSGPSEHHNAQSSTSQRKPNGRSLAQPIGPAWASNRAQADDDAKHVQSLKTKNERLIMQMKRSVELIIYHKVLYVFHICETSHHGY
jgi:hypothetical protein